MKFGYKSETGTAWLAIASLVVLPFLPCKARLAYAPIWAVVSRMVARGASNKERPVVTDKDSSNAESRPKISRDMSLFERPLAIVTGTNSGIGYFTAVNLAVEGYIVVITCRSTVLVQQTAERVRQEAQRRRRNNPGKYSDVPEIIVVIGETALECDNFESVRNFVSWFSARFTKYNVQLLVNNAGGMIRELRFSRFNPSLEHHTAVNFLGPMLLTELLLPILETRGGRVVYVSSEAHRFPQMVLEKSGFGGLKKRVKARGPDGYSGLIDGNLLAALKELNQGAEKTTGPLAQDYLGKAFVRYGTSKLFNAYHAHHIARRYANVADKSKRVYACSLHPGCVSTNFSKDLLMFDWLNTAFQYVGLLFLKSWEEGAQTTLHCCMCPKEELELVTPEVNGKVGSASSGVAPYFVECENKTDRMLLDYGWDITEAESIIAWGKSIVGLPA